ncbi:unnamed protein product [Lasius platythorax]|uniref:THAP-type domain-containing protein n=1 Tax=Lasius platythorax TaxID=488582 RepID=A0AAV2NW53_9HYME
MSKRCAILNCPYVGNKIKDKKTLFRFPQIASVIEKWIAATGRTNWIPNEYSAICEMHFTSEDFSSTKIRKRLKPDAIPTKHLYENANSTDMYGNNMHLATTVESDNYRDVLQYTIGTSQSEIEKENDSMHNLSSLINTDTIEQAKVKLNTSKPKTSPSHETNTFSKRITML